MSASGGTLVNLALGAAAFLSLASGRGATSLRYFLWLVGTLNLLQGAGYWLFSGIGRVGDWARVIEGWPPVRCWPSSSSSSWARASGCEGESAVEAQRPLGRPQCEAGSLHLEGSGGRQHARILAVEGRARARD